MEKYSAEIICFVIFKIVPLIHGITFVYIYIYYYDSTVKRFNHHTTQTPPTGPLD